MIMRPVITISLNGNSYQLEQDGYEALRAYLATAEARLADNPDKAEILADLEQAIAEKCSGYLNPHKTVVSSEEVQQVIRDMGPVDGGTGGESSAAPGEAGAAGSQTTEQTGTATGSAGTGRRLYQIREGAMLSGVCNGLAAYFNVDVTIVRVIFVVLTLLTGGFWIVAYLILMFVVPYAETSEEHAAAHGLPFNAQELIDRAKQHYAQFKNGQYWRRRWREQRRFWKSQQRQWRAESRYWREYQRAHTGAPWVDPRTDHTNRATYILGGLFLPIFALISGVLFLVLVLAILSLVTTHAVLGWALPPHIPLWAAIVIAVVLYSVVVSPLRFARHAGYYGPYGHGWIALWGAMLWTAIIVACVWVALLHWPQVQSFLEHLSTTIHGITQGTPPWGIDT
jgi:phage shock protein PspC (stress-responsive transcriptional regulator)